MKKFKPILLGMALIAAIITTGCATTAPGNLDKATKTAIVLKSTARSAIFYANSKDPVNTKVAVDLAIATMNTFLQRDDLSPTALEVAFRNIPIRELRSVEAQLAINTLQMTYEVFWADQIRQNISSNAVAVTVLTGLRDGLVLGKADISPPPTQ
jgi:hypothetical protein